MKIDVATEQLFTVTIGDTSHCLTRQEAEHLYSLLGNSFGSFKDDMDKAKSPVPTPLGPPYTKPFSDYPLYPNEFGPSWGDIISHPNRPGPDYTIAGSGSERNGKVEIQNHKGTGKR